MPKKRNSTDDAIKARRPAHQRIADGLLNEILQGKFRQGSQLPSTQELAKTWNSSYFTLHTALQTLAKQGWVERRSGTGTYVADLRKRFLSAGIYHCHDISTALAFPRNLHFALIREFTRMGKDIQVFVDSRPEEMQREIFPPLAEALRRRQIQCLIGAATNRFDIGEFIKLPLPMAFIDRAAARYRVTTDDASMLLTAVQSLKRKGCRTIGLISTIFDQRVPFYRDFLKAVHGEGLATRPAWIRKPDRVIKNAGLYGHTEFKKIWKLGKKPDGLIVWPDEAVRGAILAIGNLGVRVPRQMQFVFHRNAGSPVLCPFPVTWTIMDEGAVARAMIQMVEDQFVGKDVLPVYIPYRVEEYAADEWK